MKNILITIGILGIFVFLVGQGCEQAPAACTEEAKVCSDGTVVIREGPDCEFQKCPDELLGRDCGTVSPDSIDECCEIRMKDVPHVQCVGNWVYDTELGECTFICETTGTEGGTAGLPNPASVKCEEDGGELVIVNAAEGSFGYCLFDDNSVCDEWAYYRGECNKGECFKECGAIGTRSEGWYDSCTGKLIEWANCARIE